MGEAGNRESPTSYCSTANERMHQPECQRFSEEIASTRLLLRRATLRSVFTKTAYATGSTIATGALIPVFAKLQER